MTSSVTQARIRSAFSEAVHEGLSQPHKVIPARYFYDRRGSELFEEITRLPEYYPTRTEVGLIAAHSRDIGRLAGRGKVVVEFGSGSSMKTPPFVDAVAASAYVPVDISAEFLAESAKALTKAMPGLAIHPVAADFTQPIGLPASVAGRPMLGFFPGSTIGNLTPMSAVSLLRTFRATLGDEPWFVIGIDLKKNPRLLEAAYDDDAGVTAAFNLNLLSRINRELEGDIDVEAFEHRAVWNNELGRIEMHLVATRDIGFSIEGRRYRMREAETIHTENSYKYTIDEARLLARVAGWTPVRYWTDERELFSLHLWRSERLALQP